MYENNLNLVQLFSPLFFLQTVIACNLSMYVCAENLGNVLFCSFSVAYTW